MFRNKDTTAVKQSAARSRLFFFLAFGFLCASCTGNNISPNINSPETVSLKLLPPRLQTEPLSFDKLLQSYDWLNDKQKIVALKYLLGQNNLDHRQKAETAYMLARLAQPPAEEQTLSLFDLAQTYPPLKVKSLWHQSEIAAMLGKEKLVRQALADLLAQAKDSASIAAAQYALAQSYVRANETNNACKLLCQNWGDDIVALSNCLEQW